MMKSTLVTEHYAIINLTAKENQIMIRVIPINQYVHRKKSSVSTLFLNSVIIVSSIFSKFFTGTYVTIIIIINKTSVTKYILKYDDDSKQLYVPVFWSLRFS